MGIYDMMHKWCLIQYIMITLVPRNAILKKQAENILLILMLQMKYDYQNIGLHWNENA